MATARVARGRRTEAAVAAYMAEHGWPHAERVPASIPGADITGVPDVAIVVIDLNGGDTDGDQG